MWWKFVDVLYGYATSIFRIEDYTVWKKKIPIRDRGWPVGALSHRIGTKRKKKKKFWF
jgi:hypothetical protein